MVNVCMINSVKEKDNVKMVNAQVKTIVQII